MSVLDASAFAEALTSAEPVGAAARARLAEPRRWHAPAILPAEVLSAVRGLLLGGDLTPERAERARRQLVRSRIALHPLAPLADRVWQLRDNLTVYDAWYVALAERLGTALVTTDARLARSGGPACDIELIS